MIQCLKCAMPAALSPASPRIPNFRQPTAKSAKLASTTFAMTAENDHPRDCKLNLKPPNPPAPDLNYPTFTQQTHFQVQRITPHYPSAHKFQDPLNLNYPIYPTPFLSKPQTNLYNKVNYPCVEKRRATVMLVMPGGPAQDTTCQRRFWTSQQLY